MQSSHTMRIAVDCRIDDPRQGIGTAVLALAHTLSESTISDQEYTFIVHEDLKDWLAAHIFGPCRLVGIPRPEPSKLRKVLHTVPLLPEIWRRWRPIVPLSDGYVESENFDLVHFPTQTGYVTRLPTIYQPWDLQHLHYPEFFSASEIANRERLYRTLSDQARYVCVQTEWCRTDVVDKYQIEPRKIVVIPWGSVLDAHAPPTDTVIQATIKKFNLPDQFFFYPAVTWPHKNHAVILQALGRIKVDDGRIVHAFFTGTSTPHRKKLEALARRLGVEEQVHYLGFVSPEELQVLFSTATAMIFASKFEGFGLPILEAFHALLPVICANATMLPEVAEDAALYFDPDSPEQLADQMRSMLHSSEVRRELISKGTEVLQKHSMADTALNFQKLYQRIFTEVRTGIAAPTGNHVAQSREHG
jgi:glycosyltransferase involved in cell wall biosynthesis